MINTVFGVVRVPKTAEEFNLKNRGGIIREEIYDTDLPHKKRTKILNSFLS